VHHGVVLVAYTGLVLILMCILVSTTFLDGIALLLLDHHDVARHVRFLIFTNPSWLTLVCGRLVHACPCPERGLLASLLAITSF